MSRFFFCKPLSYSVQYIPLFLDTSWIRYSISKEYYKFLSSFLLFFVSLPRKKLGWLTQITSNATSGNFQKLSYNQSKYAKIGSQISRGFLVTKQKMKSLPHQGFLSFHYAQEWKGNFLLYTHTKVISLTCHKFLSDSTMFEYCKSLSWLQR